MRLRQPFFVFCQTARRSWTHGIVHSDQVESQQAGKFGDGLDQIGMRIGLELAPAVRAAGHADDEPATRSLSFLEVGRRITDLRHSSRIADLRIEP